MRSNAFRSLVAPLASLALLAATLGLGGCVADAGGDPDDTDSVDISSTEGAITARCQTCALVVQQSIRNVKVGMTVRQVRSILGKPGAISLVKSEIIGTYKVYRYGLTEVSFAGDGVFQIFTTSDKMRTPSDIGVGSSEGAMLASVPGARCRTTRGFRNCVVEGELAGKAVTTFALDRQRITAVSIGLIID